MSQLKHLRSRLAALSRRRWLVRVLTGFSGLSLALVGALVAAFAVDWLLELPRLYRVGTLIALAGVLVWAFRRFVRPSLGWRESLIDMALLVEGRHKIDTDLVAALEFESPTADAWGSRQLEDAVIEHVGQLSRGVNVFRGMDYGTMLRRGCGLGVFVVLIGAGTGIFPGHAAAFLDRLLLGASHYPTRTQIVQVVINGRVVDLRPGKEVSVPCPQGQALDFRVHAGGVLPDGGTAKLWDIESGAKSDVDLTPITSSAGSVALSLRERKAETATDQRATETQSADRRELIRRASLDLTGVPPTEEEMAAFLADDSPQAYETLVDRLLASPAYGERFAKQWLELARQSGAKTNDRNAYRDFVIRALNDPQPIGDGRADGKSPTSKPVPQLGAIDQFIVERLEGDLRASESRDSDPPAGTKVYAGRIAKLISSIGFQIYLGDAWTDPAYVRVVPLPRPDVDLRVTPPDYAAGGDETLDVAKGQRQITVLENSRVDLLLTCNKPLALAKLVIKNQEYPLIRSAVDAAAAGEVWTLAGDSPLRRISEPTHFVIHALDQDDLAPEKPIEGFIRLRSDSPPKAYADVRTKHVLRSAVASVFYGASDDYGLAELKLSVRVLRSGQNDSPAKEFKLPLGEQAAVGSSAAEIASRRRPRRVSSMLFQLDRSFEKLLTQSGQAPPPALRDEFAQRHVTLSEQATIPFARAGGGRWVLADPKQGLDFEIRHENPKLNVYRIYPLSLSEFDLRVGDQVRIELLATDYRGEAPGKSAASEALVLTVTDETGFLAATTETDQRSAEQLDAIIRLGLGE